MPRPKFCLVLALVLTGATLAAPTLAQIVPLTPPPSDAAPVPESAAEANARAVPGPPVTHIERSATPGEPDKVVTIFPSNLAPPPPAALNRDYPPCSEAVQDGCRNPGTTDDEPHAGDARIEAPRPPRG